MIVLDFYYVHILRLKDKVLCYLRRIKLKKKKMKEK